MASEDIWVAVIVEVKDMWAKFICLSIGYLCSSNVYMFCCILLQHHVHVCVLRKCMLRPYLCSPLGVVFCVQVVSCLLFVVNTNNFWSIFKLDYPKIFRCSCMPILARLGLILGSSWGHLGVVLVHLGLSRAHVDSSWAHLGLIFVHLGSSCAHVGSCWLLLEASWMKIYEKQ